jgi:hypothetical protein
MIEGLEETFAVEAAALRSLKSVPERKITLKSISKTTTSTRRRSLKAVNIIGCLGVKLSRTKSPKPFSLSNKRERALEPFLPTTPFASRETQD